MDAELKQYLEAMEGRLTAKSEAMEGRLTAKSEALEGRLTAKAEAMEGRLTAKAEALEERVNARIEKAETNLLTAFHSWARPMEIRVRGVSGVAFGFDERLALAEERISEGWSLQAVDRGAIAHHHHHYAARNPEAFRPLFRFPSCVHVCAP